MQALIAPTKNPRRKFYLMHGRFRLTKTKELSMTLMTNMDDITLPNGRFILNLMISEFRYLGSYIARHGTDTKDVRARINSAARAFGALSK